MECLRSVSGGAVALITGRAIRDETGFTVQRNGNRGQHGLEIRSADGTLTTHPIREGSLTSVRNALTDAVEAHPGLMAEFKGLSIALHYRHAPTLASYAHRLMRSLRQTFVPDYVIQKGKRVVELKPAGMDKGVAIAT